MSNQPMGEANLDGAGGEAGCWLLLACVLAALWPCLAEKPLPCRDVWVSEQGGVVTKPIR